MFKKISNNYVSIERTMNNSLINLNIEMIALTDASSIGWPSSCLDNIRTELLDANLGNSNSSIRLQAFV